MTVSTASERELPVLLSHTLAGDDGSFEEMYRTHSSYVRKIVRRTLHRSSDVEDVVQETFAAAFQGLARLRNRSALRGWLRTVAIRNCMSVLRRRYERPEELGDLHRDEEPTTDPVQENFALELYAAVHSLPCELRGVWVSLRVEGMTFAGVAREHQLSESTVKRRIRAADERLGRRLTPMNAVFPGFGSARL